MSTEKRPAVLVLTDTEAGQRIRATAAARDQTAEEFVLEATEGGAAGSGASPIGEEPNYAVPNDTDPWSVADVLGEMMAGAYTPATRVDVHGLRLYRMASDGAPNVWAVHPEGGGAAFDAVNLGNFATAGDVEDHILTLANEQEEDR